MKVRCYIAFVVCIGLMLFMASCSKCCKVVGIVDTIGYEGRDVFLTEYLPGKINRLDSCKVESGKFQMCTQIDSTRMVFLCKGNRPIVPLFLEQGEATVYIRPTEITVTGTRQNDLFYNFYKKKVSYDNRFEDLTQLRESYIRRGFGSRYVESLQDSLKKVVNDCESMICSFMSDNYSEPAAVGVFMMLTATPEREMPKLIRSILDAAPDDFISHNSYVRNYVNAMDYQR